MNEWIEIVLRIPVFAAIIILAILIAILVFSIIRVKKNQTKFDKLNQDFNQELTNNQNLRSEFDNYKKSAEADAQKYEFFLRKITHEVKNPLQSIQASLENFAHLQPGDKDSFQKYFERISSEILRLRDLVENVRSLSPSRTEAREAVNMKKVIEKVILSLGDYADQRNVSLEFLHLADRISKVLGYQNDLVVIVRNLVENSIKYSKDEGGKVIVSLGEDDNWVHIRVTDNGLGIHEEDLPYITEGFRSPSTLVSEKESGGLGFGLPIVKNLVNLHNGNFRIESETGKGTTVYLDFPKSISQ